MILGVIKFGVQFLIFEAQNKNGLSILGLGRSNIGGQGQNRTADTGIFSPLLYRLSYLAKYRKAGIKLKVGGGCQD